MKLKKLLSCLTAAVVAASILLTVSATAFAQEDLRFSPEYKTSPFYEKLTLALENSQGKTTMEKVLAVALSQEGYKNFATAGADLAEAREKGWLWTGTELRMNDYDTGNTEYTRWAQRYVMDSSENGQYLDCDWCAIYVSWCLYQGGYYDEEKLKRYYYAYCAEPRVEYAADSWILAYDLDQRNVWYSPKAHHKLDAYDWNTYYNVDVDPYDFPYKPGGLVFFSWDGSGQYFDHVAIVVDYDPETHVLTFSNGNSEGQVITRQIDLDLEEEFRGMAYTKNSNRVMAYGEYDAIKPPEPKTITAEYPAVCWDRGAYGGFRLKTNSESVIVSVSVDGEYLGSNVESNMLLHEGEVVVGKSELTGLSVGQHTVQLAFDDGVYEFGLLVCDSEGLTDKLYGDANLDGRIDVTDVTLMQNASIGLVSLTDLQNTLGDVNGDGKLSILDATCVQKYLAQYAQDTGRTGEPLAA